ALPIGADGIVVVRAVDPEQADRLAPADDGLVGSHDERTDELAEPGARDVRPERRFGRVVEVRIDRDDALPAGRARGGREDDGRLPPGAPDLDDDAPPGARAGERPEVARLVVGEPAVDAARDVADPALAGLARGDRHARFLAVGFAAGQTAASRSAVRERQIAYT